jgi:hypothetical protein
LNQWFRRLFATHLPLDICANGLHRLDEQQRDERGRDRGRQLANSAPRWRHSRSSARRVVTRKDNRELLVGLTKTGRIADEATPAEAR